MVYGSGGRKGCVFLSTDFLKLSLSQTIKQMDVSKKSGFSPQIIHFNRVFHYKPSILRYPYFWKHPNPVSGIADFKVPRRPLIFFGKGLLLGAGSWNVVGGTTLMAEIPFTTTVWIWMYKPCKSWDKLYQPQLVNAGFLPSTVSEVVIAILEHLARNNVIHPYPIVYTERF